MSSWPDKITIGTFQADVDLAGDYRLTTKVEGWGSPARRLNVNEISGYDGAWVAGGFYSARTITHYGFIEQGTATAANALADELAAFHPGTAVTYAVDHEALGARQVSAYVTVGAEPEWIDDRSFTYTLTLVAPDPFKRSTTATTTALASGDSTTVANGSLPAELEVTVTSSGTLALTAGGLTLTSGSTVVAAGTVIKTADRTITDGSGAFFYPLAPGSQWPALPAGGGSVANSGTAALSVVTYDTYA